MHDKIFLAGTVELTIRKQVTGEQNTKCTIT